MNEREKKRGVRKWIVTTRKRKKKRYFKWSNWVDTRKIEKELKNKSELLWQEKKRSEAYEKK